MKKLEDIPKKNIFEVPDGYFEKLPGIIQSRVVKEKSSWAWVPSWQASLKIAFPVIALVAAGIFWLRSPAPLDMQNELAQLQPEQIEEYLSQDAFEDIDITTEELAAGAAWSSSDLDELEKKVYSGYDTPHEDVQTILDQIDNDL